MLLRGLLAALAALMIVPALAGAVTVQGDSVAVHVPGSDHGDVLWPGDAAELTPTVENTDADTATGVTGTLSSAAATVTGATAGFPDLSFGTSRAASSPFGVQVPDTAVCGADLPFGLGLDWTGGGSGAGSGNVDLSVPTGSTGPAQPSDATDLPRAIPDGSGFASSGITLGTGRVKALKVRIGEIDHPYTGDLQLDLVAPDGTTVRLMEASGLQGADVRNLTFSDAAFGSISSAVAPFGGTYRPVEPLSALNGHDMQGRWELRVADKTNQDSGTLVSWGMDVSRAICSDGPLPGLTATPNPAEPGSPVTLDASSSLDPGAQITKYEFDYGDGTGFHDVGASPTTTHTFAGGAYDVRVRITDDFGGAGGPRSATSAPFHLSVGQPPSAALQASTSTPATGETVTFDASGSTAPEGGSIVKYEWDFDGDGTFDRTTDAAHPTTTWTYAKAGEKTPHVRVTSDIAATDTAGLSGAFAVRDRPPVASFSAPSVVVVGNQATFTSTSTDPDDNVAHYAWTVTPQNGAPAATIDQGGDTPVLKATFPSPGGSYVVALSVTDDAGESSTTAATRTVKATRPPTASFTFSPSPVTPDTPVTFDGRGSSDPDGPIAAYAWDFDNNGTYDASGATPTFDAGFSGIGAHTVKLRVTDGDGATATTTRTVTVKNDPPVAALDASPNPVLLGAPVTLSAAGSSDPDGSVTSYDWDLDGDGTYEVTKPASFVTVFSVAGTHAIGVRVHDDHGATATKRVDLVVDAPATGGGGGGGGGTGTGTGTGSDPGSTSTGGGTGSGGTLTPPAKTPPKTGGGTTSGGGTSTGASRFLAQLAGTVLQRAKTVGRRGMSASCRATLAGRCVVVAKVSARDARKLGIKARGAKPVTIGQAKVAVAAGRSRALRIKLNRTGRRMVKAKRLRRVAVRLSAVVTDASGRHARASRVLLIRR